MEKFGYGITIPDPQHCYKLFLFLILSAMKKPPHDGTPCDGFLALNVGPFGYL
jgi:hypothetical protein